MGWDIFRKKKNNDYDFDKIKKKIEDEKENKKEDKIENHSLDNIKLYINGISPLSQISLNLNTVNGEELNNLIYNYIKEEKNKFFTKKEIIYNYFLCDNEKKFYSNEFLENNIQTTNNFRYYSIYFIFERDYLQVINFYYKLFFNINIIFSHLTKNYEEKKILNTLPLLNGSTDWIITIPCYMLSFLINNLIEIPQIKIILVNCHGKHKHKEDFFKSTDKYKGIFTNHKDLMNILNEINKNFSITYKLNYELESENKYNKYNFEIVPDIKSEIKNNIRYIHKIYRYKRKFIRNSTNRKLFGIYP